ncbi:hypothetical protein [Peribacillus sp. SCS-37]|uniref:hypothetical protein n=1 Tax=Paraperibacillus esterisolvens TaxID=3115296 RepID=UPI0039059710
MKPAGIKEFMAPAAKKSLYGMYPDYIIEEDKNFIWAPQIKCQVKFRNYTKDGKLRIPSFVEYIL